MCARPVPCVAFSTTRTQIMVRGSKDTRIGVPRMQTFRRQNKRYKSKCDTQTEIKRKSPSRFRLRLRFWNKIRSPFSYHQRPFECLVAHLLLNLLMGESTEKLCHQIYDKLKFCVFRGVN